MKEKKEPDTGVDSLLTDEETKTMGNKGKDTADGEMTAVDEEGGNMKKPNIRMLDRIVKNTIGAIEKSREEIFDIYEAARAELENVRTDVERVKHETTQIILQVDDMEKKDRRARLRLMEVSRNFRVYSEEDIKGAYEEARVIQVELAVAREQEQNLRNQRDTLEVRLKNLGLTVVKAENLTSQVGVVLGFLNSQMGDVANQIENLQQKQIFSAKIIRAQEEERRRVARDIHDGPAQAMANIVFRAEVCERLLDTDLERAKHELKDLREQVRQVLKETRKIIFDLRPMTLDDLGLVPTIRRVLETVKQRSGLQSDVIVMGTERRLDNYVEIGMFRVIQEALHNVEKHASAHNIWVRIDFRPTVVSAVVEDDGKGFELECVVGQESFGIMGMQERIALLNGELEVKSEIGKGTKIFMRVPLKASTLQELEGDKEKNVE